MEKEIRNTNNLIKRADEASRIVEGTAIVFNSDSVDMGFIEQIDPNAVSEETIKYTFFFSEV